jgi:hypothetical protein
MHSDAPHQSAISPCLHRPSSKSDTHPWSSRKCMNAIVNISSTCARSALTGNRHSSTGICLSLQPRPQQRQQPRRQTLLHKPQNRLHDTGRRAATSAAARGAQARPSWASLRSPTGTGAQAASCTARCLRLLDVRSGAGGHLPPATDAGSAVVSDNQSQSLKRLKFSQDGSFAWAVPASSCWIGPPAASGSNSRPEAGPRAPVCTSSPTRASWRRSGSSASIRRTATAIVSRSGCR